MSSSYTALRRASTNTRGSKRPQPYSALTTTILTLATGLLLAACADSNAQTPRDSAPESAASPAAPVISVEVATARADTIASEVIVTGRVEAEQAIDVRPEVDGRIVAIHVREGQPVAAGTPLFTIDDRELRAQVTRAEAERDLARQLLARTTELVAQQAAATADLERAEAAYRASQAQLDLLSLRLARTVVRAPFSGVAGQRVVSLGDQVSPQSRLVSLQTTNPQRVVLAIPERFAAAVRRGQAVHFGVAAYPGERFTAAVDFVDPIVMLPARTITVKALARNGNARLQPGMFAEARLTTSVRTDAVTIPEEALMPTPGGAYAVWVVADGIARRRVITIGVRRTGTVEATHGLVAGEQVVVGGVQQLAEGAAVSPSPARGAPPVLNRGVSSTEPLGATP